MNLRYKPFSVTHYSGKVDLLLEVYSQGAVIFCRFHVGGYPDNMLPGDGIIDSYENIEGGNVKVPDGIATIIQKLQVSFAVFWFTLISTGMRVVV